MDVFELEGVAAWALEHMGMEEPPVDAVDLAELMELPLEHVPGTGGRLSERRTILLGTGTPIRQVHSTIAHECAHALLDELGLHNGEDEARYLGAALLVPRRALDRQLRAGWDLDALRCVHVNASAELIARRVVDVRTSAGLAIYDGGRCRRRLGVASCTHEREMVEEAMATGGPVRMDSLTGAWPVFVGGWRRVLVLAG